MLSRQSNRQGIPGYIAGVDGSPNIFRRDGHVTLSNTFVPKETKPGRFMPAVFNMLVNLLGGKMRMNYTSEMKLLSL